MPRPPLFQRATVVRVVRETLDARTFVLDPHDGPFTYRAGQFCTFRIRVNGADFLRSYSMSSAPETDAELMTTVKRVPGGAVSNWLLDHLAEGDVVELTRPAGRFVLREAEGPVLGFAGGSGITPIVSLAKSALAATGREVRLLCADRDRESALFREALDELAARHPGRLEIVRHLDADGGFLTAAAIAAFVGGDGASDCYVCGPEPFMDLVEAALPGPGAVFTERFGAVPEEPAAPVAEVEGSVTIVIGRKKATVPLRTGETLLQSARRAGLSPPFSCEAGDCATCIARLTEGSAKMLVNAALTDEEVAEGYVLTCQGVPDPPGVTVVYE